VNRDYAGGFGVGVRVARDRYGHTGGGFERMPNVILAHSTGILREAGHRIDFCDAQAEDLDARRVLDRVGAVDPDLLVTCINLPSLDGDRSLLASIRNAYPGLPIVASGTVCKTLPGDAIGGGLVDLSPMVEEESVIALAAQCLADGLPVTRAPGGLAWVDGALVPSGPAPPARPLDDLPFPAYDLMPMGAYTMRLLGRTLRYAPIFTTRGCPFPCTYCPYPIGLGSKVRYRTPARVIQEIELVRDLGAEGLIFRDQTFSLNKKHAESVCRLLAEKGLGMQWSCETRVDLVTDPMLQLMRKAGCRVIEYGMETGDPELLAAVGKPGATLEDLRDAVRLTRRAGLMARVHLIIGLPGETWQTVQRTLDALFELRVDNADFNVITPYPGTPLHAWAVERGFLLARSWSDYTGIDPAMRTEQMTAEDLKRAQLYLDWSFRRNAPFVTRWGRRWRVFRYNADRMERLGRFVKGRALTAFPPGRLRDEVPFGPAAK